MIFFRPVPRAFPITQGFGENPDDYPKTHGHNGIDYGVPSGTKVLAAASGQVILAALDPETVKDPKAGYGMHVRILHPNNVLTLYGHLSDPLVQPGQMVQVGEPIGLSDTTGRCTGPHLHFEVRTGLALLNSIDPAPFMTDTIPSANVLYSVEVTAEGDGLRARNGPSKDAKVIKNFRTGDVIQVLEEVEDKAWLRFVDGFIMNNPDWIKKLGVPADQVADPQPAQPVETPAGPVLYSIQVTPEGSGLRVRKGPSQDSEILFNLHSGDVLEVFEEIDDNAWLRVRDGFIMNNPEWVQKVGN